MVNEETPPREAALEDDDLREALDRIEPILQAFRERFASRVLDPRVDGLSSFLDNFAAEALAGLERIERGARVDGFADPATRELVRGVRGDLFGWLSTAIEETVSDQEQAVSRTLLLQSLTHLDKGLKRLPTLSVPLEEARFVRAPGDRAGVRLLKACRRGRGSLGRLLGRRVRPQRRVVLAELAAFKLGKPLGGELRIAANALSVMRVDVWRGCRVVVDQLEVVFRYALGRVEDDPPHLDKLVAARIEIADELDLVSRNLYASGETLVARLERRLRELMADTVRAAAVAGTWELPRRAYPFAKAVESRRRDRNAIADNKTAWDQIVAATAGALVMRLRAESVLARFEELLVACTNVVRDSSLSPVPEYPREVAEQLDEARQTLAELIESGPKTPELAAKLAEEQTYLEGFVTRIAVGEMASAIDPTALSRPFDELFEALEALLLELPGSFRLRVDPWAELPAEDPNLGRLEIVEFPFSELCREVLKDEVRLRLHDRQKSLGLLLREVADELTEIAHFVAFAFEGAAKAVEDGKNELLGELLLGGLDEARARTRRLVEAGGQRSQEILTQLDAVSVEQAQILWEIVVQVDIEEARRRVGQVGIADRTIAEEAEEAAAPAVGHLGARLRQSVVNGRAWVSGQLGFERSTPPQLDRHDAVTGFAHLASRPIPRSYRRLFETAAFGVEDILAGQQAELAQLEAAVQRWRAGRPTSVAIVGERGAGRTTIVERALRRLLADVAVKRRNLVGRISTETALAGELSQLVFNREETDLGRVRRMLEQHNEPLAVVLEGLEHVLLRTYDGLEPLVRLLNIVSRSGADLLWLVSVDAAAWGFMDTFLDASDHFTHVVELGRLTREQSEQLVLRRHRISGLGLAFQPHGQPAGPGISEPLPLEGARQQRYFDTLQRVAGGHPVSTMFAWLDAIVEVTEDGVVVLGPPRDVGHALGDQIPIDRLINLAAIMMHGSLTEAELAEVGRMNPRHAASLLAQLQAANLVQVVTGAVDRYAVNPVLYRPLFERLRRRRMI